MRRMCLDDKLSACKGVRLSFSSPPPPALPLPSRVCPIYSIGYRCIRREFRPQPRGYQAKFEQEQERFVVDLVAPLSCFVANAKLSLQMSAALDFDGSGCKVHTQRL